MSLTFLCHSSHDSEFVLQVVSHLERRQQTFHYERDQTATEDFQDTYRRALEESTAFVVFIGSDLDRSTYVCEEIERIDERISHDSTLQAIVVDLVARSLPAWIARLKSLSQRPRILREPERELRPAECAKEIFEKFGWDWAGHDGLPANPHLFSYEKTIIEFFVKKRSLAARATEDPEIRKMLQQGCPPDWPQVRRMTTHLENQLSQGTLGEFRSDDATVAAAALRGKGVLGQNLGFPEARPRSRLAFPPQNRQRRVTAGIVVSGGIAPGINAVIDGLVQRHWLYAGKNGSNHRLELRGYQNGFHAFEDPHSVRLLIPLETSEHARDGGSALGTYRLDDLLDGDKRVAKLREIGDALKRDKVDILYIVGGDGSMKAAHALFTIANADPGRRDPLSVVAIPKTMDNDILWMWQSFGFPSAVEEAREIVEHLYTEVSSNPRLCILQLFGSDSGFVVSHAVLGSAAGHCDLALIPEVEFSLRVVARHLARRMSEEKRDIPYGLVVMAETAIPVDVGEFLDSVDLTRLEREAIDDFVRLRKQGRRIEGQTSDALRTGGLKVVRQGLEALLKEMGPEIDSSLHWNKVRAFQNEPRHLVRAMPPSTQDVILGQRLGMLAVDNAMAGYTDFMISQWLTEFVLVPLELVVLGRKRIPEAGMFWKSVLAKTGQPANLVG